MQRQTAAGREEQLEAVTFFTQRAAADAPGSGTGAPERQGCGALRGRVPLQGVRRVQGGGARGHLTARRLRERLRPLQGIAFPSLLLKPY